MGYSKSKNKHYWQVWKAHYSRGISRKEAHLETRKTIKAQSS